jgi:hypothetical protein
VTKGLSFPPPEGLLKQRENSVIALLVEPDQAEAAVQDLVAQGFDRDGIYVLCTPVAGRTRGDVAPEPVRPLCARARALLGR